MYAEIPNEPPSTESPASSKEPEEQKNVETEQEDG